MPTSEQLCALQTQIAPAAVACEQRTGMPAEATAAQCIVESGWLAHAPNNNCFGIKINPGAQGRALLHTREWFNATELAGFLARGDGRTAEPDPQIRGQVKGRNCYLVRDWFATFANLSDCFAYRAHLLLNSPLYKPALQQFQKDRNLEAYIKSIAAHYATDPTYAAAVEKFATSKEVVDAVNAVRQATSGYQR